MNEPRLQFPVTLALRIRRNTAHGNLCHVWIIGTAPCGVESCLMHGTVTEEHAELLAEMLGLPVTREDQRLVVVDGAVEREAERTKDGSSTL